MNFIRIKENDYINLDNINTIEFNGYNESSKEWMIVMKFRDEDFPRNIFLDKESYSKFYQIFLKEIITF